MKAKTLALGGTACVVLAAAAMLAVPVQAQTPPTDPELIAQEHAKAQAQYELDIAEFQRQASAYQAEREAYEAAMAAYRADTELLALGPELYGAPLVFADPAAVPLFADPAWRESVNIRGDVWALDEIDTFVVATPAIIADPLITADPTLELVNMPVQDSFGNIVGTVVDIAGPVIDAETGVAEPAQVAIMLNDGRAVWVDYAHLGYDAEQLAVITDLTATQLAGLPPAVS